MIKGTDHIKKIKVVSNTHWDREFRRSFELTRRSLLDMMDTLLEILGNDESYHSFTLDGHSILLEDYLEMRPEKEGLIRRYLEEGRLIAGPYYTLAEQFSISSEAMVRNLAFGRKTVRKYGGVTGTVAYTPSSWGQSGQLPQILLDFGIDKMMFYRGISHHESEAEYIWFAPDGSRVYASRFALYARYNWYYQVHRPVTRNGRVFEKDFKWGEFDEMPLRLVDLPPGSDPSFELKDPALHYDRSILKKSIEEMIRREGSHFTTDLFLAMHGHDISVPHPLESKIISDAREDLAGVYEIEHCSLEDFWREAIEKLDEGSLAQLSGERRAYLKEGMWTYLFPGTISARTYLKQKDFSVSTRLSGSAEPLSVMAACLGEAYPFNYLERAWTFLLSNHTHDANGGCAPDAVCMDMEYRYRKTSDICDIVIEDAITHIVKNLSPAGQDLQCQQLVLFNPLPIERDVVLPLDLEIPRELQTASLSFSAENDRKVEIQTLDHVASSVFVDSAWDVPCILESTKHRLYANFSKIPPLSYRAYTISVQEQQEIAQESLVQGDYCLENKYLRVELNSNATVDIHCKESGQSYLGLNYISDRGEAGNAWQHENLENDQLFDSLGVSAHLKVVLDGPLIATLRAEFILPLPADYEDGSRRSERLVETPIMISYTLEKGSRILKVKTEIDNRAKDHWLRVNFPTRIQAERSFADTHFDVVGRDIKLPDSEGWVEDPQGTHPLQTFVDVNDGRMGLALLPKGIFEYEHLDDSEKTLALTLIRACRIKLKVSEEKITELDDAGIQCPGYQCFEYAIYPHSGNWLDSDCLHMAAAYTVPVRAVQSGRGKGKLPLEKSILSLDNRVVRVTAIKYSDDGSGLIIRFFNPSEEAQKVTLSFHIQILRAFRLRMDESSIEELRPDENSVTCVADPKKIVTLKLGL